MARYRLKAQHYSEEDKLLEIDTEVGDGTEHKWTGPPTPEMEALDEAGQKALDRERLRAGDHIAPIDDLPLTMGETQARYDKEIEAAVAQTMAERRAAAQTATERAARTAPTLADRVRR